MADKYLYSFEVLKNLNRTLHFRSRSILLEIETV